MFDRSIPLLIVPLLLLWILDHLGLLDVVGVVFELIVALIAGVVKLATYLIRGLGGPAKPQP